MICEQVGLDHNVDGNSSLFDNNTPETRTTVFSHRNVEDTVMSQTQNIESSISQNKIPSSKN